MKWNKKAYSESDFRMREMYSNKGASAPPWAMQAFLRCEGSLVMSVFEAKLPINWDSMSPKCWEAFPRFIGLVHVTMNIDQIMHE